MGSGEWGVGDRGKAKQSEDSDDLVEWRHYCKDVPGPRAGGLYSDDGANEGSEVTGIIENGRN